MLSVCVVMTVHNRRAITLRCLDALFGQSSGEHSFRLTAVIVDDGSTDATAEAAAQRHGDRVVVIPGAGSLYWSAGMALAQNRAQMTRPDYLLWVNDDIQPDGDAVVRLLEVALHDAHPVVVVGAMRSGEGGPSTYSGWRRLGPRPGYVARIEPSDQPIPVDTMNGNLVLVPREIYRTVGTVDARFSHGYGDWDYGYRVTAAGFGILLAPGFLGVCERNPRTKFWRNASLPRRDRLQYLFGIKGMPVHDNIRFLRRHGGWRWPRYLVATYVRALGRIALGR